MTPLTRDQVRGYRRCPCGRLFPLPKGRGRPPVYCHWHRQRVDMGAYHRLIRGSRGFVSSA